MSPVPGKPGGSGGHPRGPQRPVGRSDAMILAGVVGIPAPERGPACRDWGVPGWCRHRGGNCLVYRSAMPVREPGSRQPDSAPQRPSATPGSAMRVRALHVPNVLRLASSPRCTAVTNCSSGGMLRRIGSARSMARSPAASNHGRSHHHCADCAGGSTLENIIGVACRSRSNGIAFLLNVARHGGVSKPEPGSGAQPAMPVGNSMLLRRL